MLTVQQARVAVAPLIGLPSAFDGSPGAIAALAPRDAERLEVETVRFILDNRELFAPPVVAVAETAAQKKNFGSIGDYTRATLLDQSADFVRAYGETAGETIVGAAGVAGRSAKALGLNLGALVGIAAVVAILYFGSPYVLPRLREALK